MVWQVAMSRVAEVRQSKFPFLQRSSVGKKFPWVGGATSLAFIDGSNSAEGSSAELAHQSLKGPTAKVRSRKIRKLKGTAMKNRKILGVMFMAAVCFSPPVVVAQNQTDADRPREGQRRTGDRLKESDTVEKSRRIRTEKARLSRVKPAEKVIGMQVRNHQDQSLAKINDLVVDLQRGTIAYAILEGGGVLGIGDKLIAVPAEYFSLSADGKNYLLDTTKEKLLSAPSFDQANWPDTSSKAWQEVVRNYHGEGLGVVADSDRAASRSIKPEQRIGFMRASKVDGAKIKTVAGQDLGKVWDLMVDLPSGKVLFVAIEDKPGESNMANVPPTAFQAGPDKDVLYLAAGLGDVPRSGRDGAYTPAYAARVYDLYKADPQWDANETDADNTRRNVRDASGESLTPLDQGNTPADREITRQLRKWIVVEPGQDRFSGLAHNIKIITRDGKVTLRGPVQSEEEKKLIVAHARQLPGVVDVDDQLEVKQK
jgi:sporulation protein YlmC with PRC-barrel domain